VLWQRERPDDTAEGVCAMSTQVTIFYSLRLPGRLTDALVGLQGKYEDRIEPQDRQHMHVTLAFPGRVEANRLADAAALLNDGSWPAVPLGFTGEVRHGSWELRKDPGYRHRPETVQTGEQVRLGIEPVAELTAVHSRLRQGLDLPHEDFWPHVTLGLARRDIPTGELLPLPLPEGTVTAAGLELQQELTASRFRVLTRAP
jgi:2'-5' RNA ligase